MPTPTKAIKNAVSGSVLNSIHLLPQLSMKNREIIAPVQFIIVKGKALRSIADLFSSLPKPACFIISGP